MQTQHEKNRKQHTISFNFKSESKINKLIKLDKLKAFRNSIVMQYYFLRINGSVIFRALLFQVRVELLPNFYRFIGKKLLPIYR